MRRAGFSLGLLALGAGMLIAAEAVPTAPGFKRGGIFRFGTAGASVQIDPQVAYVTTAWWLEYATAARLFNYPDRRGPAGTRLVPEVASGYRVTRDGRTWTFTIRKGFRFSDGSPVTAKSFARAIDRVANKALASPGAPFITAANGTEIVGAREVNDGKARHVRGVVARGNRLVIRLARPDGAFLTTLAMPFFQATSPKLPLDREVTSGYPSAGPYVFSRTVPDSLTELRRNPYYRGKRPRNLNGVDVHWNLDEETAYRRVVAGMLDEGPAPAAHLQEVARAYGVNRTRFWSKPTSCVGTIAFNRYRPLLRNNPALRRAINWAVDRKAYAASAGPYAANPWTHLLPPTSPGSVTAPRQQPYAVTPRLRKARQLAAGHLRRGRVTIGYRRSIPGGAPQVDVLRRALVALGMDAGRITMRGYSGADLYDVMGKRGTDLDFGVSLGWCVDASNPELVLNQFLDLGGPTYRRKLAAAAALKGYARFRALGKLDVELMKDLAPVAPMRTYNNRFFFSARVDPKSLVYENVYSDWSIPALALK